MPDPVFWKSAVLGVVQGLTEFLPVSSTGHLIVVGKFLHLEEPEGVFTTMFNVVIQLSSILAVVIYFRDRLFPLALFRDREIRARTFGIWLKTAVAVLPALFIGFLVKDYVEMLQRSPGVVAGALFLGGIVLIGAEKWFKHASPVESVERFSWGRALGVGFFQCVAMIPGVSRSAATIVGGLALGAARPLAAEFSFFLAVPTMAAASGYSLLRHGGALDARQWIALGIGFLVSFLVSWGVIAWLMEFIRKRSFEAFGYYRIVLAVGIVLYFSCRS